MEILRLVLALTIVVGLAGIATAPADTGCIGTCGSGSGGGDSCPTCDDPSEPTPLTNKMCVDDEDNDSDGNKDGSDLGCVKPYNYDWIEGNIWDSDLTSILNDDSGKQESIFYQGTVDQGNDFNDKSSTDQSSSGPQVVEYYIEDRGTETNNKWGFGKLNQKTVNDFPPGTQLKDGRVVDPPTDLADPSNLKYTCGDGYKNEEEDLNTLSSNSEGDEKGKNSAEIECTNDFGRILTIHEDENPFDDKGKTGMKCRDDVASCTSSSSCNTWADSSCSGGEDCGAEADASVSCGIDEDYTSDEGNYRWEVDGDEIYKMVCKDSSDPEVSNEPIAEDEETVTSSECSVTDTYSTGQYCKSSATCTDSDSASDSDSAGEHRAWVEKDRRYCHDSYSVVDGGGDDSSASPRAVEDRTSADGGHEPVMDNDPAATYTRFTAHRDDSWTGTDPDDGKVWCGYDYTVTVNADGPRGNGDGFVVIDNGEIAATMSPDGSDSVGKRVYVDGSDFSGGFNSRRDKIESSCSGEKTTCLKYVDYYVKEGSGNSGSPEWTADNDGSVENDGSIVQVEEEEIKLSEGYSACKLANYINEENGDGREIVDCDFERGDSDTHDVSPLPQACGDEPQEHLIVTEGNEVIEENTQDFLKHSQKCVDWGDEQGELGEDIDSDACVYRGRAYAEGTVIDIRSPNGEFFPGSEQYERGEKSPDREVCLDPDDHSIDMDTPLDNDDGQYLPWDNTGNDISNKDYGGEWYDLDNEMMNDYLRNEGSDLISSGDQSDSKDIAYYWGDNPNPDHSEYNPAGGKEGIALEDDCGKIVDCDDTGDIIDGKIVDGSGDPYEDGLFYSFFSKRVQDNEDPDGSTVRRDEDYNETGDDQSSSPQFRGYMNKLKSISDQMEQDPEYYPNPSSNTWSNSDGSEDDADQWGISRYLSWSISNRGVPYPPGPVGSAVGEIEYNVGNHLYNIYTDQSTHDDIPAGGTYYHHDYDGSIRTSVRDYGVDKDEKVFANSFAAVADQEFEDEKGDTVMEGEGVWIDPDDIKELDSKIKGGWREKVVFNIDITGPDSGLGFNTGDDAGINPRQNGKAVYGDIYFAGENDGINNDNNDGTDEGWDNPDTVGEWNESLNPPMCGDDESEYLLEEIGESVNPRQGDGRYACSPTRSVCVHRSGEPRIIPEGDFRNTNEPMESQGRLKKDDEVCLEREYDFLNQDKNVAKWWDQDWGWIELTSATKTDNWDWVTLTKDGGKVVNTCRENGLYGSEGVRWFNETYVKNNPYAVTGGIDDDWNEHLKRRPFSANQSRPDRTLDLKNLGTDKSPVPTGSTPNKSIATIGFCGGDDASEYFVTQQCNSDLCDTKRDVQGVSRNPEGCVFDGAAAKYPVQENSVSGVPVEERAVYQPGDTVTLDPGGSDSEYRELTCFDNTWYRDFPVVFSQEQVDVPLGGIQRVSFQLINVRDSPRTFDVSLEPGSDIYTFTTFDGEEGDSFQTTVQSESSQTHRVEIRGGNLDIDASDLTIEAEAVNTDMFGEDTLTVDVVNSTAANGTVTRQEPESVPGIAPIQLMVLILMASATFFLQS